MASKKHIVIVTTLFYPVNRVASYRVNSFAKYFSKDKFDISVICLLNDESRIESEEVFNSNVYRVPSNKLVKKRRQKTSDNWFVHKSKSVNNILVDRLTNEDFPGWAKNASNKLTQLHAKQPIDLIISSYAPKDAHLAALNFLKDKIGIKWIADMRDEMSMNPFISNKEKTILRTLELNIASRVDAVTSVSKPILDGFEAIMGGEILYEEIRNGYDHEVPPLHNFNEVFTMLYAGTFYGKRKPNTFFEALLNLKAKDKLPSDWKLQLLGTHANFSVPNELKSHLEFLPTADNESAVQMMLEADCNVLIHPPMGVKGVFTGKLFEYISAEKPVLALVDKEDVAAELITEQNAGFNADFYSINEIEDAFLRVYSLWKNREHLPFNTDKVKTLHRRHQAKLMENLIDRILS